MTRGKWSPEDWRNGWRTCACCELVFDRHSARMSTFKRGRGGSVWFCSPECRRRYERETDGEEVEPLLGDLLDEGFALIAQAEDGEV